MKSQKNICLCKNSAEKQLSLNIIANNLVINLGNDSSITNSHQSKFTKDQSTSTGKPSSEQLAVLFTPCLILFLSEMFFAIMKASLVFSLDVD